MVQIHTQKQIGRKLVEKHICKAAGISGASAFLFGKISAIGFRHATTISTGVLLTGANTAHLPARETLVRASTEPVERQQSVLLRAASRSDTTPAEQLMRPVGAQE